MVLEEKNTLPDYFYNAAMTNHEQKIWLAFRLGILEFWKRFAGKHKSTECIFNDCKEEDTLGHSIECKRNPVKLKNKRNSDMLKYLRELHTVRLAWVGVGLYWL